MGVGWAAGLRAKTPGEAAGERVRRDLKDLKEELHDVMTVKVKATLDAGKSSVPP